MSGKCSLCASPEREALERALVSGVSQRQVAAMFKCGKSAVGNHAAKHLPQSLERAAARAGEDREDGLREELQEIHREAQGILYQARRSKDHGAALGALAGLCRHVELVARFRPAAPTAPTRVRLEFKDGSVHTSGPIPRSIDVEVVEEAPHDASGGAIAEPAVPAHPRIFENIPRAPLVEEESAPPAQDQHAHGCTHPGAERCQDEDFQNEMTRGGVGRDRYRDF